MSGVSSKFVWFDYNAYDKDKAVAFYTDVVGWGTAPHGDDGYTMLRAGETLTGGIMTIPDGAREMGAPSH